MSIFHCVDPRLGPVSREILAERIDYDVLTKEGSLFHPGNWRQLNPAARETVGFIDDRIALKRFGELCVKIPLTGTIAGSSVPFANRALWEVGAFQEQPFPEVIPRALIVFDPDQVMLGKTVTVTVLPE